MSLTPCLFITSCPDQQVARSVADTLVKAHLAACIHIIPQVESVYRWEGEIHHDSEWVLIIKSDLNHCALIEALLQQHHPYELPELLAVPISTGSNDYLQWMARELRVSADPIPTINP